MNSYNIPSPQGPRVHLPVTYFLFRDTTFHLVLAVSASLRPKYGTPYLFTSANLKLTLPSNVILRRTTLFHPILPLAAPVMRPDSLPRLWRYINLLLTYLLTYLKLCLNLCSKFAPRTRTQALKTTPPLTDSDINDWLVKLCPAFTDRTCLE